MKYNLNSSNLKNLSKLSTNKQAHTTKLISSTKHSTNTIISKKVDKTSAPSSLHSNLNFRRTNFIINKLEDFKKTLPSLSPKSH